jgi:hypothetical protein
VTLGRIWRGAPALACALGLACWAPRALAASACGRPDLLDTVPPDKEMNLPPNAALSAHYDVSAEYLGEDVILTTPDGNDQAVRVTFDSTQGLLTFKPPSPLDPGDYKLAWPSLRGLNTATPGKGAAITFTVGQQPDVEPPVFDGLTAVRWDLERQKNDCTDALENRFVFDFDLAPASDDGGPGGLTLVIFQTAGASIDGGSVPVLSRAMPLDGHAQVKLPVADATGHVCFAALARDTIDQTSNGGSHEVCVQTTAPPFFRGCATAPGRGTAVGLALVGLALLRCRRRARE